MGAVMSELPDLSAQKPYALDQLAQLQGKIIQLSKSMVLQRARIERCRQSDLAAARDIYAELSRTRETLVETLAQVQLFLMEMEEYALAKVSGQLRQGLAGFALMSTGYKSVYEALSRFASSLPVGQKTNAAVVGRLMNNIKLGYYPTDPDMLEHLTLLDRHGENLLGRGLSEDRIRENGYRSMPETERGRRLLADLLRSHGHDLRGVPGFRTYYGEWTLSGPNGFLIPVRNKDGLIQGLKIRLDEADHPNRKYRWLSSRSLPNGTRSYSWVHVTGDRTRKRAFLTEGPLKGDVASFLAKDALFICIGGVNALHGLTDTIRELGVHEVVETMDMDQMTNSNVRNAILAMRKEVQKIPGIRYAKYTWNPAYKGVDDYLLSRTATM